MANKPKHLKPKDSDVVAANEIYEAGKKSAEAEIARLKEYASAAPLDHQAIGEMRMLAYQREHIDLLELLVLYRVKQSKDYKKSGMTWEQFCDAVGKKVRTMDALIAEIRPVYEVVSAKLATFSGIDARKIKYLGKAISANSAEIKNGILIYGNEKVPLTPEHRDEVQDLLEKIESDLKKRADEAEANLRSAKRIIRERDGAIDKKNKLLDRYEGRARAKDLTPEEDGFLAFLDQRKIGFDGYMLTVEPGRLDEIKGGPESGVTPRMRAAYIEALGYMRKQIVAAHDTAVEMFGADLSDGNGEWRQPG